MKKQILITALLTLLFSKAFASGDKKMSVSWQLGPETSSYNLDVGVSRVSTLGLHYQMQFSEQKSSNTNFLVKGLSNYGLNYEHFVGPNASKFKSGFVLTAGIHMTKLEESSIHQVIIYEGKEEIRSGESEMGGRIAASYRFYARSLFAGAGVEGSKVGKAVSFLPIKVQLGVVF
ncbi:MAG: hypothetical protein ACJAT2_001595 [Bacteriovoracaceae bacterium]|jgi:hypothetical protein